MFPTQTHKVVRCFSRRSTTSNTALHGAPLPQTLSSTAFHCLKHCRSRRFTALNTAFQHICCAQASGSGWTSAAAWGPRPRWAATAWRSAPDTCSAAGHLFSKEICSVIGRLSSHDTCPARPLPCCPAAPLLTMPLCRARPFSHRPPRPSSVQPSPGRRPACPVCSAETGGRTLPGPASVPGPEPHLPSPPPGAGGEEAPEGDANRHGGDSRRCLRDRPLRPGASM